MTFRSAHDISYPRLLSLYLRSYLSSAPASTSITKSLSPNILSSPLIQSCLFNPSLFTSFHPPRLLIKPPPIHTIHILIMFWFFSINNRQSQCVPHPGRTVATCIRSRPGLWISHSKFHHHLSLFSCHSWRDCALKSIKLVGWWRLHFKSRRDISFSDHRPILQA